MLSVKKIFKKENLPIYSKEKKFFSRFVRQNVTLEELQCFHLFWMKLSAHQFTEKKSMKEVKDVHDKLKKFLPHPTPFSLMFIARVFILTNDHHVKGTKITLDEGRGSSSISKPT